MITPTFSVSQEDDFVSIVIKAPHIKTQNVDFEVEGAVFKFNVKPYFLRLTFPGNIVDDERAKATYNVGVGEMTVILPKETPGEHFPDLDMLTKLLVRQSDLKDKQIKKPLIEVIGSSSGGDSNSVATLEGTEKVNRDEEIDWELPQEIKQEIFSEVRYGFNNRYNGFFTHVQETANDVLDVYDPEHTTLETRRQNRIQRENEKFDDEYYIQKNRSDITAASTTKSNSNRGNETQKASVNNAGCTFKSTLSNNLSQLSSTPSILNIVKDEPGQNKSSATATTSLDDFGIREASSRKTTTKEVKSLLKPTISTTTTATTSIATASGNSGLTLDLKEPSTPTSTLLPNTNTLTPMVEPLIDESRDEPVKYLGSHSIIIVDPSRPSTNSELEGEMADLKLDGDGQSGLDTKPFTNKEQELMRDLPRREYILENTKSTYLSLIDILFAYSYDLRVSEGDTTVETPWTICKLSPSMAALDQFTTLKETIVACIRRSLAYPLIRNWSLAMKVLQDVYVILKLGRRGCLRALLQIKNILDHDDVYYIYSKMFIEDYCVWIQSGASENVIRTLAHEIHHFDVKKEEIGWHLEELEALAKEAPEEEEEETEEEDSDDTSAEGDDDDDEEEDSDDDDSSSSSDQDSQTDDKSRSKDNNFAAEEESIFIHEGPKPMIVEL
ncbi:hypothetical protein BX616_003115 [Lobosporangium transversale]|nr:hypothetical protein BX616_003115 [Lobosporangium transversale]